jgi:hypothetical protein
VVHLIGPTDVGVLVGDGGLEMSEMSQSQEPVVGVGASDPFDPLPEEKADPDESDKLSEELPAEPDAETPGTGS